MLRPTKVPYGQVLTFGRPSIVRLGGPRRRQSDERTPCRRYSEWRSINSHHLSVLAVSHDQQLRSTGSQGYPIPRHRQPALSDSGRGAALIVGPTACPWSEPLKNLSPLHGGHGRVVILPNIASRIHNLTLFTIGDFPELEGVVTKS